MNEINSNRMAEIKMRDMRAFDTEFIEDPDVKKYIDLAAQKLAFADQKNSSTYRAASKDYDFDDNKKANNIEVINSQYEDAKNTLADKLDKISPHDYQALVDASCVMNHKGSNAYEATTQAVQVENAIQNMDSKQMASAIMRMSPRGIQDFLENAKKTGYETPSQQDTIAMAKQARENLYNPEGKRPNILDKDTLTATLEDAASRANTEYEAKQRLASREITPENKKLFEQNLTTIKSDPENKAVNPELMNYMAMKETAKSINEALGSKQQSDAFRKAAMDTIKSINPAELSGSDYMKYIEETTGGNLNNKIENRVGLTSAVEKMTDDQFNAFKSHIAQYDGKDDVMRNINMHEKADQHINDYLKYVEANCPECMPSDEQKKDMAKDVINGIQNTPPDKRVAYNGTNLLNDVKMNEMLSKLQSSVVQKHFETEEMARQQARNTVKRPNLTPDFSGIDGSSSASLENSQNDFGK